MSVRPTRVVVSAVAVVALLGACSNQPGAAAVVDDRVISQAELEQAHEDLAELLTDPTPASILSVLVVAPTFIDAAEAHGVGVSAEDARILVEQSAEAAGIEVPELGAGALELARFTLAAQALQGLEDGAEVIAEVEADIAELDVTINPRYGQLDPATGAVVALDQPWLVAAAPAQPE